MSPARDNDILNWMIRPMHRPYSLPETGFVRLANLLAPDGPIPVSKSTWWSGVKSGRFPKPVKLGPRITAWRVEEIRALIANGTG
jgi:predicted DNA-binding transcriptional regulator AlpA